jgi:hypothetical protein
MAIVVAVQLDQSGTKIWRLRRYLEAETMMRKT